MCEILAPAGDIKGAYAAINAGADAVYLGLKQFSARSSAENFGIEEFKELSAYARAFGVKIYVAMNTMIKDCELQSFLHGVVEVWNTGADAVILSDVFLGKFIKQNYPQIKLHLSTQAGVCNAYAAEFAKECGFDRVILSRETALGDIEKISEIIETEVFIQGALCTCFSGQCYLSSFAGGNSGNRGKCKQPCRKKYSIDRRGFEEAAYRLSLSDLSVGEDIKKLIDAGVSSFKIEGRLRRPEYVSAAVAYYRSILSGEDLSGGLSDLKRTFNRGNYTKGLAFGQDKNFISSAVQGHIGEFVGVIKVYNGKYGVLSRFSFEKGDAFKVLRDGKEVGGADFSENFNDGFIVKSSAKLRSGDKVFVTTDVAVNRRLLSKIRQIPVRVSANFTAGKVAQVEVNGVKTFLKEPLQKAQSRPLCEEDIKKCFNKVDKYPFEVSFCDIVTQNAFISAAELNSLRREAYQKLFGALSENKNPQLYFDNNLPALRTAENKKSAVICTDFDGFCGDIAIFKPDDYADLSKINKPNGQLYLYLPPFMTSAEAKSLEIDREKFDGVYCEGLWALGFARKRNLKIFAGIGLNISNRIGVSACDFEYIALSKELTPEEQAAIGQGNVFALSCGNIKVMDLIYCPFGKRCYDCDRKKIYTLADEDGRKFPIRRYKTSACRFEVFNCADLVGTPSVGAIADCTLQDDCKASQMSYDIKEQKAYFKNYTRGRAASPIL